MSQVSGSSTNWKNQFPAVRRAVAASVLISAVMLAMSPEIANAAGPKTPGPVSTVSPPGDPGPEVWARQNRLVAFSDWIRGLPSVEAAGYVASIDDVEKLSTTLLWHGNSPLQDQILKEGEARGLRVTFRQRSMNRPEIYAALQRLQSEQSSDPAWGSFRSAVIVGIDPDRDALVVKGDWTTGAPSASAEARAQPSSAPTSQPLASPVKPGDLQTLASRAATATGAAVHVISGVRVVPYSRQDDTSPFYSGGFMINGDGSKCSSGFAVNYEGAAYTTTARHCGGTWKSRNGGASYGNTKVKSDLGMARVLNGGGDGWMFGGSYSSGSVRPVKSLIDLNVGNWVCTSGGNTGEHCNMQVTNLAVVYNDGYGSAYTIEATQRTSGAIAAGTGDSGGPVFTCEVAPACTAVRAAGMIQGGNSYKSGSSCGPARDQSGLICGNKVYFTSMRTVVDSLPAPASLVTS